jgi:hypothetical protein
MNPFDAIRSTANGLGAGTALLGQLSTLVTGQLGDDPGAVALTFALGGVGTLVVPGAVQREGATFRKRRENVPVIGSQRRVRLNYSREVPQLTVTVKLFDDIAPAGLLGEATKGLRSAFDDLTGGETQGPITRFDRLKLLANMYHYTDPQGREPVWQVGHNPVFGALGFKLVSFDDMNVSRDNTNAGFIHVTCTFEQVDFDTFGATPATTEELVDPPELPFGDVPAEKPAPDNFGDRLLGNMKDMFGGDALWGAS